MTELSREEALAIAEECGFDTDLPAFKEGHAIALKLAAVIYSKGFAAGAEDKRFFLDHGLWHDRVTGQHIYTQDQYDELRRDAFHHGYEAGAEDMRERASIASMHYGPIAEAIRALPITPTNQGEQP